MQDRTPLPFAIHGVKPMHDDRRSEPRWPCTLEVSCQPITGKGCDLWWLGEIRDVSRGGIGLVSTRRFENGIFIAVQLANLATAASQTRVARVVHVAASSHRWFIGCALQTPFDAEDLQALVVRHPKQ
ncbi:hypothetical protein AYO44_02030 [Planctomycetaceae bacterium SCGC AG-212-F19]|nr:hypothetical protein AYO44_02030 [Planctomycetaceae bacterium SCGC AG-212-F19]